MQITTQKGFTLIEVIVVIAVAAILMITAGFYLGNKSETAQLKSAARDLISNMNLARTRAIRDSLPWSLKFNPAGNSYQVLNNGKEFRTVTLPTRVSFESSQDGLDGTPAEDVDEVDFVGDEVTFNPNGTCSGTGAVYLTITSGRTYAVSSLAASGMTKIQRNDGSGWSH